MKAKRIELLARIRTDDHDRAWREEGAVRASQVCICGGGRDPVGGDRSGSYSHAQRIGARLGDRDMRPNAGLRRSPCGRWRRATRTERCHRGRNAKPSRDQSSSNLRGCAHRPLGIVPNRTHPAPPAPDRRRRPGRRGSCSLRGAKTVGGGPARGCRALLPAPLRRSRARGDGPGGGCRGRLRSVRDGFDRRRGGAGGVTARGAVAPAGSPPPPESSLATLPRPGAGLGSRADARTGRGAASAWW